MPHRSRSSTLSLTLPPSARAAWCLCLVAFAALIPAASASADVVGGQVQVNTIDVQSGPYSPGNPAAAYDSNLDRYLVVWASEHESAGTSAIWGRFMSADGAPVAAPFKVANARTASDGLDAINARVAYSAPLKRYFVAFNGAVPDSDTEILGVWLGDSGARIGNLLNLSGNTWGGTDQPQVIANDARSGVSVIYTAATDAVQVRSVFGNVVTASGPGAPKRITPATTVKYLIPSATVNESNGDVAIAMLLETDGSPNETYTGEVGVLRATADLNAIGGVVRPFPDGQNLSYKPSIAWNGARNQYVLVWPRQQVDRELWSARYDAGLTQVGKSSPVSQMGPVGDAAYGTGWDSSVVASARSDQYAAFWMGDIPGTNHGDEHYETYARPLDGDMQLLTPQVQISAMGPTPGTTFYREQLVGAVAYDSRRDRWFVPWTGHIGSAGWQIYARLFEPIRVAQPATAETPAAPAPACPGQQQYVTKKGAQCRPLPVPKFSVGATARGGKLLRLLVTPTAKGQTITVRCVKRCGKGSRSVKTKVRKGTKVGIAVTRIKSKKGSTIEIQASAKGQTARYRQYKVLGKYPLIKGSSAGCTLPKQLKATC